MTDLAIAKLDKETREFKGGQIPQAIHKSVAETLKNFCLQNAEFAQAVVQNDKTLSECCKEISKDISRSNAVLSDIEAYRRAVSFYFPGAGVHMEMQIDLCANVSGEAPAAKSQSKIIRLDLNDLMDF